jgi:hypothetical protein
MEDYRFQRGSLRLSLVAAVQQGFAAVQQDFNATFRDWIRAVQGPRKSAVRPARPARVHSAGLTVCTVPD